MYAIRSYYAKAPGAFSPVQPEYPGGYMQEKILLVDDDEKMNALLVRYLSEFGFQIHPCP